MERKELTLREARKLAREYGVKLPRCGYEVSLDGKGAWLASNGHADFGSFGLPADTKPFHVRGLRGDK